MVTGAAGFIGSHVAETLLARGDAVVGLDNINDYYDPSQKKDNLRLLQDVARDGELTFVEGDIRNDVLVADLFKEHRFDGVVHLAAMAGVRNSIENPGLYYDVNLVGTQVLLDQSVSTDQPGPMPNFVFASTSSVYGNTQRIPFTETDPCDRPLVPYSSSKRAAEMMGYSYHYLHGLDFSALRFFTVYGPRGRPDMMAFKVAESVSTGREIPLNNGGDMFRDWTYITDIVSGVVAAADRRLGYDVINLGRGEPTRLGDFVALVEESLGGKANLVPQPMPEGDVPRTHADVSKAHELLNYHPTMTVSDGVKLFVEWYRSSKGL